MSAVVKITLRNIFNVQLYLTIAVTNKSDVNVDVIMLLGLASYSFTMDNHFGLSNDDCNVKVTILVKSP